MAGTLDSCPLEGSTVLQSYYEEVIHMIVHIHETRMRFSENNSFLRKDKIADNLRKK